MRHCFHESLIEAADPIQDDEIGRGSPSGMAIWQTAAKVAAGCLPWPVNYHLGKGRLQVFPIACG
jgi:hypothetical protein